MEQSLVIIPATDAQAWAQVETLAWVIIPDFYVQFLPLEHCQYYVQTLQTVEAIAQQVAQGYAYYLLYWHGQLVGYMAIQPQENILFLSKLYLLKTHRSKGIGGQVMRWLFVWTQQQHLTAIRLMVNQKNTDSIAFYQKWGFEIKDEWVNRFGNGHEEQDYIMQRAV